MNISYVSPGTSFPTHRVYFRLQISMPGRDPRLAAFGELRAAAPSILTPEPQPASRPVGSPYLSEDIWDCVLDRSPNVTITIVVWGLE